MRMMTDAYRSRTHRQPTGLNAGVAERHRIRGGEFLRQLWNRQRTTGEICAEPCRSNSIGGRGNEFAPFHWNLLRGSWLDVQKRSRYLHFFGNVTPVLG